MPNLKLLSESNLAVGDVISTGMMLSADGTGTVVGHQLEIEFFTSGDVSVSAHVGNSATTTAGNPAWLSQIENLTIPATAAKFSLAPKWTSKTATADPVSAAAKLNRGPVLTPFQMSPGRVYYGATDPVTLGFPVQNGDVWYDTS